MTTFTIPARGRKLRFRFPKVNLTRETLLRTCGLPNKFCGTCSLREGSAVMITVIQLVTAVALAVVVIMLTSLSIKIDEWWDNKLKTDFKPWFGDRTRTYVTNFRNVWKTVAWTIVGLASSYLFVGLGVIIGLLKKTNTIRWYVPWLIYTFILLVTSYTFIGAELAFVLIFTTHREVTITQEVMPIVLSVVIASIWTYAFIVVCSHVKKKHAGNKIAQMKLKAMMMKKNKMVAKNEA